MGKIATTYKCLYTTNFSSPALVGLRAGRKGGKMNQDKMVLEHLQRKPITTLEAIKLYGVTRLSAVIWRLRHNQKLDVRDRRISVKNRYGRKTSVKQYYIVKEQSGK